MLRLLPPLVAAVLIVGTGIVHGFWSDRWVPAIEPQKAAERLATIPMSVGEWDGKEPDTPGESVPGVVGSVQRRFTNRMTGATVMLALVCGRPGPVSIHTPDSCYAASGYTLAGQSVIAVSLGADFWTGDAVRVKATEETRLRLFWAWNAGQGWTAPDDARTTFARQPVLHKLYVLRELNSLAEPVKDDPALAFIRALLPELNAHLFAPGL
jgi:uncharacterized protein DUF3485